MIEEEEKHEPDEIDPPKNPMFGKFDEIVDAALTHRPRERRILFRKRMKPKEEEQD